MELSWLTDLAPSLVLAVLMGIILVFIVRSGSPLLKGMSEGVESLQRSFESVNKQQNELIDRQEALSRREIDLMREEVDKNRKELEVEKIARADLERRFNEANSELIQVKAELAVVQTARKRVEEERDTLADKVKILETEMAELRRRLDDKNGSPKE